MSVTPITFYSDGFKLVGDLYTPDDLRPGEPKKLVVLEGYGHYEVYAEPAFSEVMRETLAWFREHLPPA